MSSFFTSATRCNKPSNRYVFGKKSGYLKSPNFPQTYPDNQDCSYFIGTADAKKIELTFENLEFERGKDELAIGSGSSADPARALRVFDQQRYNPMPAPVVIQGDRAWMNF